MTPLETSFLAFQILAFLIALCIGSFLNVCIARMPEDRSVVSPPSHCPSCGAGIQPSDNIPVLSWLWLRGKCRSCGIRISPLYPVIELLTGLLGLLLFRHMIPVPEAVTMPNLVAWTVFLGFLAMLIASSFIDLQHFIIPDQFSQNAVPFGVAAMALLSWMGWSGALSWTQSLAGAIVGAGSLLSIIGAYWLVRREEGMGFGDVKLLAMIGAFLGAVPAIPFVIIVSSVLGSVAGLALMVRQGTGMKTQLPFGPFLALAAVLYVFFGHDLTRPAMHNLLMMWDLPRVFLGTL
jgi:leader peptidase (prepilin peptidase)/N-methyltransferase